MAGKVDTRQKMINMMYLVFIAMLALNISKEVLATIGVINEDLETSIKQLSNDNTVKYATIDNLQSQPEYQVIYPFVQLLKSKSDTYVSYLSDLKNELLDSDKEGTKYIRDVKNKSDNSKPNQQMTDYQIMDKSIFIMEHFNPEALYCLNLFSMAIYVFVCEKIVHLENYGFVIKSSKIIS